MLGNICGVQCHTKVSRERHDHREEVLCPGLFFAMRVAELPLSIKEMPYALNASPAVLPEFSRVRRRDACSRAELYDVCDAGADGHLCRTRAHGNICDAAYHDGNPLALARTVAPGAICRRRVYSLAHWQWSGHSVEHHCSPCWSSTNIRTKRWFAARRVDARLHVGQRCNRVAGPRSRTMIQR